MSKQAAQPPQDLNAMMEPWISAVKTWNAEAEKFNQGMMDRVNKALEEGHQVTKETLDMAASVRSTMHKQFTSQVERTCNWMTSMVR